MRKLHLAALAVALSVLVAGCHRSTIGLGELSEYVLAKCMWYEDDQALLAFEKLGEYESLRLVDYQLSTGVGRILIDEDVTVQFSDRFLINDQYVGYEALEEVLIINRATKEVMAKHRRPETDKLMCFSRDMAYTIHLRADGLYLTDNAASVTVRLDSPSNQLALSWADDSSQVVYIDDEWNLGVVSIPAGEWQVLKGGTDFNYEADWVDITNCYWLSDSFMLVTMPCEDNDTLALIGVDGHRRTIRENGRITVLAVKGQYVVYSVVGVTSETRLACLDCSTYAVETICTTKADTFCADFSPRGWKVMVGTYSEGKNQVQTMVLTLPGP